MRPVAETLGKGIEEQNEKSERCELEGEGIELPGSEEKYRDGCHREEPRETGGERAGSESPLSGAGIFFVVAQVSDAVDGHGGAAGRNHGDDNPEELMPGGPTVGGEARGEEGTGERERQGENGVLELDHFEREANALEKLRQSATILMW